MTKSVSVLAVLTLAALLTSAAVPGPAVAQTGQAPTAAQPLTELKQAEEVAKLRQEVIALQRQNALQESGGTVLYWLSGLSGLIGGVFAILLAWFGVYWRRAYSDSERRKSDSERRKLEQAREIEREKHNLELLKGLGSETARLQLASASVILQRIGDITRKQADASELIERSYLIEALVAVTKEPEPDDRLCKFIGDGLLRALQTAGAEARRPGQASPFRAVDLQKSYLHDVFWRGADLREVDLFRVDLSKASLREADLSGAVLFQARLRGTVLRDARLIGANLAEADLAGADLRNADLTGAILTGTDLEQARLDGATLAGVVTDERTRLPGAAGDA